MVLVKGVKHLRYFEIERNETLDEFIQRLKVNIRIKDFAVTSVSEPMGRGIQVITLSNAFGEHLKLEVLEDQVEEVVSFFSVVNTKPRRKPVAYEGLEIINLDDFFEEF